MVLPLCPPPPHCSVAHSLLLGTMSNCLFIGNCFLICWSHYSWIIIKLNILKPTRVWWAQQAMAVKGISIENRSYKVQDAMTVPYCYAVNGLQIATKTVGNPRGRAQLSQGCSTFGIPRGQRLSTFSSPIQEPLEGKSAWWEPEIWHEPCWGSITTLWGGCLQMIHYSRDLRFSQSILWEFLEFLLLFKENYPPKCTPISYRHFLTY